MSQYGLIGPEVLKGDEGCYLLPIKDETGHAEAALVEPWACVEAAYTWSHRDGLKPDGGRLIVAAEGNSLRLSEDGKAWSGKGEVPRPAGGGGYDDIVFKGTPTPEAFEAACGNLQKVAS
jgi:hypothetical protein